MPPDDLLAKMLGEVLAHVFPTVALDSASSTNVPMDQFSDG